MVDADDETGLTPQSDPKDGGSNLPRETLVSNSEIVWFLVLIDYPYYVAIPSVIGII